MSGKRIFGIVLIAIVTVTFAAPASWAGRPAQHRMEGVVIGIGALILTKAIIDHHRHEVAAATPAAHRYRHHRPRRAPAGHWEVQKTWVPATYKKVWNPGHYNRRGRWVPGRWLNIEIEPGHWSKRRIWIRYH